MGSSNFDNLTAQTPWKPWLRGNQNPSVFREAEVIHLWFLRRNNENQKIMKWPLQREKKKKSLQRNKWGCENPLQGKRQMYFQK